MHKIAVGPQARGAVDISDTPENNLRRVAFAMNVQVQDLTVVLLDRPRHQALLERLRALGARVAIVSDGDVGLAMMAAWPGSGIDVMIGSGGTREAIVAACAMRCLGGELQCRPWVRHEDEAAAMREAGYDPEASLSMEQLVPGREVSVAVTGISGGGLLRGVRYHNWWAETHSLVMRAQSGTVREIIAKHHVALQPDQARKVALTPDASRSAALLEPPSRALRAGMWTASLGLRVLGSGRYAIGDVIGTCIYAGSALEPAAMRGESPAPRPTLDAPGARGGAPSRRFATTRGRRWTSSGSTGCRRTRCTATSAPTGSSTRSGDRRARRGSLRARPLRQLGRRRVVRVRVGTARHRGDGAGRPRPGDQDRRLGEAAPGPRGAGVVERGARAHPGGAPGEVRRDPQRHPRSRRDGDRRLLRRQGRVQHRGGVAGAGCARCR